MDTNMRFHEYFAEWIEVYKKGAVRPITFQKYEMSLKRLKEIAPDLSITQISRRSYQTLLNDYAKTHERQTVMDFHHHMKGAILDAVDEGLLSVDPTRKAVVKGKAVSKQRNKFLSQAELQAVLERLTLTEEPSYDWLILLIAKTGLRFAEALAVTPNDFDFTNRKLSITRTWNYKVEAGGFGKTKNESSVRTIPIDAKLSEQFCALTEGMARDEPIFAHGRVFNSTVNGRLKRLCVMAGAPVITIHGLRHTHASILIYAGVSVASVARRLGHSSVTTTQETYIHIIRELESQDNDKTVNYLSTISGGGATT